MSSGTRTIYPPVRLSTSRSLSFFLWLSTHLSEPIYLNLSLQYLFLNPSQLISIYPNLSEWIIPSMDQCLNICMYLRIIMIYDIFFKHLENSQQLMCLSPTIPHAKMEQKHIRLTRCRWFVLPGLWHNTNCDLAPTCWRVLDCFQHTWQLGKKSQKCQCHHHHHHQHQHQHHHHHHHLHHHHHHHHHHEHWIIIWYMGHFWHSGGMSCSYKWNFYWFW